MNIVDGVIILFTMLELLNIVLLYFQPDSKRGNAMGYFKAWETSKNDKEIHALMHYLVNWVAGTKLIFIGLLILIVIEGSDRLKWLSLVVLIISISSFYWRLYPSIKNMDRENQLTQKGYSKSLSLMILLFIACFVLVAVVELI